MARSSTTAFRMLAPAALLALAGLMAGPVAAQPAADAFLREFRLAVRNGDRQAVAAKIQFPIVVRMAGLRIPFADAPALLERYDDIFTPALVETIGRPGAPTVGDDGLAIGTNNVIITQVGPQFRITAIAVPPPAAGGAGASTPGNATSGLRTKTPARVSIRPGPRPTQFAGSLPRGGTDLYLLWVPKGRLLDVRLERVRGRDALIHVVHSATGAPLNPRTAAGARIVTGIPIEGADYRIEVRRTESDDPEPLPYMLSLVLK